MISFQASVSKGWLHKQGNFIFDTPYYMDPINRHYQDKKIKKFVRGVFGSYPVYNMEANLMQAAYTNENQVLVGGIQPNLILAILMGAEFISFPDKDADVSGIPLNNITGADDLPVVEKILEQPFISELEKQIDQLQRNHPELQVIPPFFWDSSGRATIHGIITTSLKLIGENVMLMLMIDPGFLHVVHQWITDVYIRLINHFTRLTGFPITSVHVGECSGAMISNGQYEEFIIPYVSHLGKILGPVRLHSCGNSDHILDAITHIDFLEVIDTGSNTSVGKIRERMGADFEINLEPPLQLMLKDSSISDLIAWLDQVLEDNRGGPLKLVLHIESDYSTENCLRIYDALLKRKLIKNRGG
jgi:hypothetical protein